MIAGYVAIGMIYAFLPLVMSLCAGVSYTNISLYIASSSAITLEH